jgi:SAM-dependent methyltransferase
MSESSEPQNIYDDETFFAGYAKLRENPYSANTLLDEPVIKGLLPYLGGARVLDLGCGTGGLCRYALEQGASSVLGVDISEKMLAVAQKKSSGDERVRYVRSSLETFAADNESFDVVISSLALHYIADLHTLCARVAGWLRLGGVFVFSVEHPAGTAERTQSGWVKDAEGNRLCWSLDNYFAEGPRSIHWLERDVHKYHRTLETHCEALFQAKLLIHAIREPKPDAAALAAYPEIASCLRHPIFLTFRACKNSL